MLETLPTMALSIRQPWAWAIINAGKRIENRNWHAGIVMVRATFRGFTAALPAPDSKPWWDVLGIDGEWMGSVRDDRE